MKCPSCKADNDRVVDSRVIGDGNAIRRRRRCLKCERRFTTYERIESAPRFVVKKGQRRELFNRDKMLAGMLRACEKRKISSEQLETVAARIESEIFEQFDHEVSSHTIGEKVSEALKNLDQVAFVRFASVYREFTDIRQFLHALAPMLSEELVHLLASRLGEGTLEGNGASDDRGQVSVDGGPSGPQQAAGETTAGEATSAAASRERERQLSDNPATPRRRGVKTAERVALTRN